MKRKRQFSLRFPFFAIAVCALLLVVWRNRPQCELRVEITPAGTAIIHEEELDFAALPAILERERFTRKLSLVRPLFVIRAGANVPLFDVIKTIQLGQAAGFEEFTFRSDSPVNDETE